MENFLLVRLAGIIVIGITAQWLGWRLKLPTILLLLLGGLLAGPVTGLIRPDEIFGELLFPIVSLSVALILFEGGLSLSLRELAPVGRVVRNLITIGALVTWLVLSAAALLAGLEPGLAVLLGALLIVTGPTVIGPLLREVRPSARVNSILKWEGIVIDPIGALLALLVFEVILSRSAGDAAAIIALGLLRTVVVGGLAGLAGAVILVLVLRRFLAPDALQNPLAMMLVIAAFTLANSVQAESGLFAVTIMGILLANQPYADVSHIVEFKENLRVLLLSGLFIVLAARISLADLAGLGWGDLGFVAAAVLVARPLSVLLSTLGSGLNWREKAFLAWMAPRGIVAASVSAVFSLRLVQASYPQAERLATMTFLLIIATVALYGLTALPVARKLGVAQLRPEGVLIIGAHPWAVTLAKAVGQQGLRVVLVDSNWNNARRAREAGLTAHPLSAVSEEALDRIDLEGIGHMLALTSNDEINSLAALHFAALFGRGEVYQLPANGSSVSPSLRGRILFGRQVDFAFLEQHIEQDMEVCALPAEELDEADGGHHRMIKLFAVEPGKHLQVFTAGSPPPELSPGKRLIALVEKSSPAADGV